MIMNARRPDYPAYDADSVVVQDCYVLDRDRGLHITFKGQVNFHLVADVAIGTTALVNPVVDPDRQLYHPPRMAAGRSGQQDVCSTLSRPALRGYQCFTTIDRGNLAASP
jgi:hypothetical protein